MHSFLNDVVKKVLDSGKELDQIKIILPSNRAVKFFKEALKKEIKTPVFSPEIVSVEGFVEELSGIQKMESVEMLFAFYDVYKSHVPKEEQNSFHQFSNWAPSLLAEFSEIDAQLVEADQIFSFMAAVERIEQWDPKNKGALSNQFFKFQKKVPHFYSKLHEKMSTEQRGYSGFQYREATQNLGHYLESTNAYHYFVGFNALTQSEETIIKELIAEQKGTILWDLDEHFYKDKLHSSSFFIRKYRKEWTFLRQEFTPNFSNHFAGKKQIEVINVSKNLAQAKAAVQLAVETYRAHPNESVVLVLGDEGILHPVLNAITAEEVPWNISMGYPLKELESAKQILTVFELVKSYNRGLFPLSVVQEVAENQTLFELLEASGVDLTQHIKKLHAQHNPNFDSKAIVAKSKVAQLIFGGFETPISFIQRMLLLYEAIKIYQVEKKYPRLELHCSDRITALLMKVMSLLESNPELKTLTDLELIFVKLLDQEKLDFFGDLFNGIQIMGILETRVLDFDHVIITHVNEGILPHGKILFSWIPFDVRKKFGMNTFIEQDHLYAYHFFRLLQRPKNIFLLYNDSAEGLFSGEKSRFLIHLEYFKLPTHQLTFRQMDFALKSQNPTLKRAEKTPAVLQRLEEVAAEGFSPSSLTLYIRDPYLFFEQRLLKIKTVEDFSTDINASEKGTLIHLVLEQLYKPYLGKAMVDEYYNEMLQKLSDSVERTFQKQQSEKGRFVGKNFLIMEVTKRIIQNFIEHERNFVKNGNQITIMSLEKEFHLPILVPEMAQKIHLKGTVDRIDKLNGTNRIVDYKTGTISTGDLNFQDWEELTTNPKKGPLFQVLLYAYALRDEFENQPLVSGIIPLKNFENKFLGVKRKSDSKGVSIQLDSSVFCDFEKQLYNLLKEIFNPQLPFEQTSSKL